MRNILIFTSEIPNGLHAGSMQLLRVFSAYPTEKLLVLGPKPPLGAEILRCPYRQISFPIMRFRNTRFHGYAMSLVMLSRLFRPCPTKVQELLGEFKPDAVFTVMDNFSHYFSAYRYAQNRGLPLITMTMDEPDSFEKILNFVRPIQKRKIKQVYRYAEKNLCVSRQMSAHIASRYDCKTEAFYFGPPDNVIPRSPEESKKLRRNGKLVLGYAGAMSYGYGEALEKICKKLEGSGNIVRIYSRDRPQWESPNMEYAGCLPSDKLWIQFKAECDASLLAYSFDYHESRLYRSHFPTKLSEYAWLGMPMVMAGPTYATGIAWGLNHPAAAKVFENDCLQGLVEFLKVFKSSPELREAMGKAAARAAKEEFEPVRIRAKFISYLKEKRA